MGRLEHSRPTRGYDIENYLVSQTATTKTTLHQTPLVSQMDTSLKGLLDYAIL